MHPWYVDIDDTETRVDIRIRSKGRVDDICPDCGCSCKGYDKRERTWHHMDLFDMECHLHCAVPRMQCPKSRKITVALDSTGLSLNKYGGWMSHRWNMKKVTGWVKLHVAVDVDTNEILAFVVTDESVGDNSCTEKLMDLVMAAGHDTGCLLADAGYDTKENWNRYSGIGIKVCFNIKSIQLNKKFAPAGRYGIKAHGCMIRAKEMKRILEIGRDEWKKENGYPMRWKVKCTFSDLKRILMDILRARTRWNCVQETLNMVSAHNLYKSIRVEMSEV